MPIPKQTTLSETLTFMAEEIGGRFGARLPENLRDMAHMKVYLEDDLNRGIVAHLQGALWHLSPKGELPVDITVPVEIAYTAKVHMRTPLTWWDMAKEALFARWYNLMTALVAWGIVSPVRYTLTECTMKRNEHTKVKATTRVKVAEVLPAACIPERERERMMRHGPESWRVPVFRHWDPRALCVDMDR